MQSCKTLTKYLAPLSAVQTIGTKCAETTRAKRIFQKLIPAGYHSGRQAAESLLAAWNDPTNRVILRRN